MNYNAYGIYQPPIQNANFSCRAVTSKEEALAAQTEYFSLGTIMPDLAHNVIYFKRFNPQTGSSDFAEFKLAAAPTQPVQYVTAAEFAEFKESIKGRIINDKSDYQRSDENSKPARNGAANGAE